MNKVVHTLLNYAPFDWIDLVNDKGEPTIFQFLATVLYTEAVFFIICFVGLFIHTFIREEVDIKLSHKIISFGFSIISILIFWYLCFFARNSIVIISLTAGTSIVFFALNLCDQWKYWGGWIFCSFVEYFTTVEERQKKLARYQQRYNDLLNFKI